MKKIVRDLSFVDPRTKFMKNGERCTFRVWDSADAALSGGCATDAEQWATRKRTKILDVAVGRWAPVAVLCTGPSAVSVATRQ